MKTRIIRTLACAFLVLAVVGNFAAAQSRALKAISIDDMKTYLKFLAAPEFRGRSAPSFELDIAAKYIALEAARIGLKPLLPNGSYFQQLPVEVTTMSPAKSYLRVLLADGELKFYFPQSFTYALRPSAEWAVAGGLVFAGTAFNSSPIDEKAFEGIDLRGKIVVLLEALRPAVTSASAGTPAGGPGGAPAAARGQFLRGKGVAGTITIIGPERENNLRQKILLFDVAERYRWLDVDTVNPAPTPAAKPAVAFAAPQATLYAAEVRQDIGAAILGINGDELNGMFTAMGKNMPIPPKAVAGRSVEIAVAFDQRLKTTPNVVAYLPGSDAVLKNEYVVLSFYHDHLTFREGRVFPGADDNMSGCVAMLEIAKALMVERPKRSVIFVWNTAEERGLVGSYYFVQHCPVPVEKISANLNFDMITRNDPNSLYLIGSNKISTELDKSINAMNARSVQLKLDYKYEDPGEPSRFFFRSDQYPYIRYGIPGVWFFCGTTPDYHTENDVEEKCDYSKMEKVTKLVFLTTLDIGNKPALLKLDVNPEITTRGSHNMKIVWQRPPQPPQK